MNAISIYLTFDGNCEEAFNFYKLILGGEFVSKMRFSDMPPSDEYPPVPEEEQNRIMHVSLPIIGNNILMGSDTGGEWAGHYKQGNNFSISLSMDSKEEADRIFEGLSEGGMVTMALADTFWGSYFGSFQDKFGVNWMVSYDANNAG